LLPSLETYMAYKYGGITFRDYLGRYLNVFDVVYHFAVKGESVSVLGRIDKGKVIDAHGKVLFDLSRSDPVFFPHAVGVSSSILQTYTEPMLIGMNEDKPGEYFETVSVVSLTIDTERKTIAIYHPPGY
jgi:hypothetical protein